MKPATVLSNVIGKFAYLEFVWRGVRLLGPTPVREAVEAPVLRGPYGIIHRNVERMPVMRRVGGVPNVSSSVVRATLDHYMEGLAPGAVS